MKNLHKSGNDNIKRSNNYIQTLRNFNYNSRSLSLHSKFAIAPNLSIEEI